MIIRIIYWIYCEIRDRNKYMTSDDVACEEAEEAYDYWNGDDYYKSR